LAFLCAEISGGAQELKRGLEFGEEQTSAAQPGFARRRGYPDRGTRSSVSRTPCSMVPGAIRVTMMDTIAWGMATSIQ